MTNTATTEFDHPDEPCFSALCGHLCTNCGHADYSHTWVGFAKTCPR